MGGAPPAAQATLHDWLYGNGWKMGVGRRDADRCYYAILRHFGVAAWRAKTEYCALRLFGAGHYKEGKKG